MRMGLALAFFTQAILYFVYMSLFKTVASIGGPVSEGPLFRAALSVVPSLCRERISWKNSHCCVESADPSRVALSMRPSRRMLDRPRDATVLAGDGVQVSQLWASMTHASVTTVTAN